MLNTAATAPLLQVNQLGKQLGARVIFRSLSFAWAQPELVCVRAPNGAGKTTLLTMLAGAALPDAGQVLLQGLDLARSREQAARQLAFVPDGCPIYPFLTGREWLAFAASVHGSSPAASDDLVARFQITPHLDTRFGAMSLGTARKFLLASALASDAPVLIMDEPTNGLDTRSLAVFKDCLDQRRSRGLVVLTCHDTQQQQLLGVRTVELADLEAVPA
ncbi:ABC transporter ATP-binding protein [Ideonella azotifigens]|uniref:ABC transporter domain-containing protein n=1 Tax=Ideonella azotifigens TaxID=513160 RepID=A0ABN1JNG9_9BURK|nr:ABC transporter ATP-binding protein [Ideonella azotifigens]MCD2339930.1 ABC transporter ATP-binding protein [Ideonella azotifigens]